MADIAHRVEELAAGCAHPLEMACQVAGATRRLNRPSQFRSNLQNRLDTVLWDFHFGWVVEDATVLKKREDTCGDVAIRLRRIP